MRTFGHAKYEPKDERIFASPTKFEAEEEIYHLDAPEGCSIDHLELSEGR